MIRQLPFVRLERAQWIRLFDCATTLHDPLWERAVYDGYWMLLEILALLMSLNTSLWVRRGA